MHPDETALPIELGSFVPWIRNNVSFSSLKQVEGPCAERVLHPAVHVLGQPGIAGQHFRRRRPSGPERLPADLGDALPGETLAADADPILKRPASALGEIELPLVRIDRERAWRLPGRILDLPASREAHVDVIVEASGRRIIRIGVWRQVGLRVLRRRSEAGKSKGEGRRGTGDAPARRKSNGCNANRDKKTSRANHQETRSTKLSPYTAKRMRRNLHSAAGAITTSSARRRGQPPPRSASISRAA